jgi:hypothetical protein
MAECDFCFEPDGWRYPATDFILDYGLGTLQQSVAGWAACNDCSELIEANDMDGLITRCVSIGQAKLQIPSSELLALIRPIFVGFFASRSGPRELVVPE